MARSSPRFVTVREATRGHWAGRGRGAHTPPARGQRRAYMRHPCTSSPSRRRNYLSPNEPPQDMQNLPSHKGSLKGLHLLHNEPSQDMQNLPSLKGSLNGLHLSACACPTSSAPGTWPSLQRRTSSCGESSATKSTTVNCPLSSTSATWTSSP